MSNERRRSSTASSSPAIKRLTHPQTMLAYTNRIASVVNRGKVLTPKETQKYRSALMCDFDRLSVPCQRPGTRAERQELTELMTFVRDSRMQGALSPSIANRSCSASPASKGSQDLLGRVSITTQDVLMQAPTAKEVHDLRVEKERILRVGHVWPPPAANQKTEEKERRLEPGKLSTALRRAVYGQSLDRVIERNEERLNACQNMDSSLMEDAAGVCEETMRVTVGDGAESSFSPVATKRNKNNNIFLMGAQEYLASREQGEEAQTVDLSSSFRLGTTSTVAANATTAGGGSQDLAVYFTNLADPAFRKALTNVTPQAYHLIRKLFQEMDDKHEGVVDLAKALQFHQKYPKKLGRDILDNLKVELDGRIYLDEMIRVHFPSVPQESIEQLLELFEPKVQSMDAVKPHTMRQLEALYRQIVTTYAHVTFASWLVSSRQSTVEAESTEVSPRPGMAGFGALVASMQVGENGGIMTAGQSSASTRAGESAAADDAVDRGSQRSRASSISRSDVGTLAPSNSSRRPSARGPASSVDSSDHSARQNTMTQEAFVPMNALQLLLHLQSTTSSFTAKDLTQFYRLKHLALRPSFSLLLARSIRRAATMTQSSTRAGGYFSAAHHSRHQAAVQVGTVTEPTTGTPIPLPLLQSPVTPTGEPSIPYLTNCIVRMQDFVLLLMDYFIIKQDDGYVEPYDPGLKAYLDSIHWDKLFPHTGPVRDYFKSLP